MQTARRRLLQKKGDKPKQALNASCEALIQLAEPGDAYSLFDATMQASFVASNVKGIEQKLGLKVNACTLM